MKTSLLASTFLLAFAGTCLGQTMEQSPKWPLELARAFGNTSAGKATSRKISAPSVRQGQLIREADPEAIRRDEERANGLLARLQDAKEAIQSGRIAEGRNILNSVVQLAPAWDEPRLELAHLAFSAGDRDYAYAVLGPRVGRSLSKLLESSASFAASLRGELYEGQSEYCLRQAAGFFMIPGSLESIPQGNSPTAVQIQSAFAIAAEYLGHNERDKATFYLKWILARQKANALANFHLGRIALAAKRVQEATRYFKASANTATKGLKRAAERDLADSQQILKN